MRYSIAAIRRLRVTQVDRTGEKSDGRERTTVRRSFSRHGFIFTFRTSLYQIAAWTRCRGGVLWNFRILLRLIGRTSTFGALPARNPNSTRIRTEWMKVVAVDWFFVTVTRPGRLKYSRCVYRRRWILATDRFLGLSNSQMQIRFHRGIIRSFLARYVLTLFLVSHIFL